ncbi:MAG: hypothetical protein GWP04_03440 [Gammaproteobacteria bacterium]|nr:hypothetical protein [Gammaproteobacteria bacterium]
MYLLAELFPNLRERRLPLSRDQIVLLLAAVNEIFLGVDIYMAHNVSGSIVAGEWIPIIFGPAAGVVLILAGALAIKRRGVATVLANATFVASAVVGVMGVYYHLERAALPVGPLAERLSTRLLVWGPPFVGPVMFIIVALWGISAVWIEDPPDSGRLRMLRGAYLRLPLAKTRAYLLIVALAAAGTTVAAVFDHARTGFENPYLWIPTLLGVFGAMAALVLAAIPRPRRSDIAGYVIAMLLLIATGVLGTVFHIDDNLTSRGVIVAERFITGAPFMAPLLFANTGTFGLVALLDPRSERPARKAPSVDGTSSARTAG